MSLFVFLSLILWIGAANGQHLSAPLIGAEYIISSATVVVGWDYVSNALGYEARLALFAKEPVTYFALAKVPSAENTVTFHRPRVGHFRAEARAWNEVDAVTCAQGGGASWDEETERCYSRWALSTTKEDATVDGASVAWWIYWQMPDVTGGGIE